MYIVRLTTSELGSINYNTPFLSENLRTQYNVLKFMTETELI